MVIPEDKKQLTSVNFHTIACVNLKMYVVLIQANKMNEAETYFQVWGTNQSFAAIKEDEEFKTKVNPSWKFLAKNDTKAMWKWIDY